MFERGLQNRDTQKKFMDVVMEANGDRRSNSNSSPVIPNVRSRRSCHANLEALVALKLAMSVSQAAEGEEAFTLVGSVK